MRRTAFVAARKGAGLTQDQLAQHLHVHRSTVVRWEAGEQVSQPYLWPKLGRLLSQSPDRLQQLIHGDDVPRPAEPETHAGLDGAFEWLDANAGWLPGTARRRVADRIATLGRRTLLDRMTARATITRAELAGHLTSYYRADQTLYRGTCDGQTFTATLVVEPDWLDLGCELAPQSDRLRTVRAPAQPFKALDGSTADLGVERLAEAAAFDVRITNSPLYRLLGIDVRRGSILGRVSVIPFVQYALTMDLLERELADAIANGTPVRPGSLPLRDRHPPDLSAVLTMAQRLCAGGSLALCAIARPAEAGREPDYVLLVQERSGHVLNATGQLAVLPKGFHGPLSDYQAEAGIRSTLLRELEEELFGRTDVDTTMGDQRAAAPVHSSRLSEPMRWLCAEADRMRLECTGFGLNLVSGNYEFASLVVIENEDFWNRYGGQLEANWETSGLRRYSTLDRELLAELTTDPQWSNEGLFALLQGIRRLGEIGGERVSLPEVELSADR